MHTTFYLSWQITKQWIVYLLVYLFSMYYFFKCSIRKTDIDRHLRPQVFCWKELWQTAKGWRDLQGFQRNALLAGFFFLVFFFFSAGAGSNFHLKNLPVSDHLIVSCATVTGAWQNGLFRGPVSLPHMVHCGWSPSFSRRELPLNFYALR